MQEKPNTENKVKPDFNEALANFDKKEVPQKKKMGWLSIVVLLVAIGIGLFLILQMSNSMGEEQQSFSEVFSSVKLPNALLVIGVLVAILLLDIFKFSVVFHATTKHFYPLISAKTSLSGRYYDNITPFASGGQPMQIYYLCNKGFHGGLASAVVMIKYLFNITAWLLVTFVCMVCNTSVLKTVETGNVLAITGWIGWSINALLPLFLLLFVLMPKFAKKLAGWVVHIGFKMKIVKDESKVMQKAETMVQDFRSAFVIISKRPVHLVVLILMCILELSLTYALPYFIIKMFNGFTPTEQNFATMFSVMALNAYANLGASIVPTPGSSGAVEGLVTMAFSSIAGSTLMWVIFTWRFATFYIYIIIGVGISLFNFIRGMVRNRRAAATTKDGGSGNATPPQDGAVEQPTNTPVADISYIDYVDVGADNADSIDSNANADDLANTVCRSNDTADGAEIPQNSVAEQPTNPSADCNDTAYIDDINSNDDTTENM